MTRRVFLSQSAVVPMALSAASETWTPLFDGRSLNGWAVVDGPESAFYVQDGAIVVHGGSNYPTWLRTNQEYENFEFKCDVFIKGWANGGLFFAAPLYGRPAECGFKVNLFQKQDTTPIAESIGAIFPVVPPKLVNVKNKGEWNSLRVLLDGPSLKVWINDALVQDLNIDSHPELRFKRRSGFIGIESLSYPLRFRNLQIRTLPSKAAPWTTLYQKPADLDLWTVLEKPKIEALGNVLRTDGLGYLETKKKYKNFEFECYIRAAKQSNGGIIFRAKGKGTDEHYEIQLHDVEGAVYPTGSLYHFARCKPYPRIGVEEWYPFQLIVKDAQCIVRINGETVVNYLKLENLDAGSIMLQAHQNNKWIEYQRIRVREI